MKKWLIRLCVVFTLLGSAACSDSKKKEPVTNPDPNLKPEKGPVAPKLPKAPKDAPRR